MKNTTTTRTDLATLVSIAAKHGLRTIEQSGFVRVERADAPFQLAARRLYVAKQKRVGRIDVAGFEPQLEGVALLSEQDRFGKVTAQVDFDRPIDVVLAAFEALCAGLAQDDAAKVSDEAQREANRQARREAQARLKAELGTSPTAPRTKAQREAAKEEPRKPETKEQRLARLELVERLSVERGVAMSEATMTALMEARAEAASEKIAD